MEKSKNNELMISKFAEESQQLIKKIKVFFKEIKFKDSLSDNVSGKQISIVFAGQYSAGKSTILKALTGIQNIPIGAGITTQKANKYDWNGIEVIDTPGIHTEQRPDHDEISYNAISSSDMLVYVITNELFDNYIGEKFRTLLIEKHKASEMILVVNKMGREGNTPDKQNAKLKSLENVTKPYTPKDIRTTFVDMENYNKSRLEKDEKYKEIYLKKSNYDLFVKTLNDFVKDKQIPTHLTTPLYKTIEVLDNAISNFQYPIGDDDLDKLEEKYRREKNFLIDTRWKIKTDVESIISKAVSNIIGIGIKTSEQIDGCKCEDDAKQFLKEAYDSIDEISNDCTKEIIGFIKKNIEKSSSDMSNFYQEKWIQNLDISINDKINKGDSKIIKFLKSDGLKNTSNTIISKTLGKNPVNGLKMFAGSDVQTMIKNTGKFFGHKFKPWESLKLTKNVNAAATFLGIFAIVLSVFFQIKKDRDDAKIEEERRKNRQEIRARFNDVANVVEKNFIKSLREYIINEFDSKIKEKDKDIEKINNECRTKSEICNKLEEYKNECNSLICNIQESMN